VRQQARSAARCASKPAAPPSAVGHRPPGLSAVVPAVFRPWYPPRSEAIMEGGVMTTAIAQDLWHSQCDALQDLTAFIDEHGPGTGQPLPLLHWRVGPSRIVRAEIHSLDREHGGAHRDPRAVLVAYSKTLGTKIVEHPD